MARFCFTMKLLFVFVLSDISVCIGIERGVQKPRVLILGGGLAGLRVGQTLQNLDMRDFLILEADNKLGGRFLSACVEGAGACVNEFNVESKLPSPHPIAELLDTCNIAHGRESLGNTKVVNDEGRDVTNETGRALAMLDEVFFSLLTEWNTTEEDMNLDGAFRLYGWNPRTPEEWVVESLYVDLFFGNQPSELSTRWYLSEWATAITPDFLSADIYNIRDSYFGNQRLVDCLKESFLNKSDERVKLNTKVSDIEYSDSGVTVTTVDGSQYDADYAVVTFSLGVLQQEEVTFRPRLSYTKRKAIHQFRMGYYTFLYSQFKSRIDGSLKRPDWNTFFYYYVSRHRNVYAFFYELFEAIENKVNHSQPYNLFSHWITDEDALRVETQDINITRAEVTEIYRLFFGPTTPEPEIFVTQANTNPLYHGGLAIYPAGVSLEDFDRLREPVGRVFFAGDAYRMTTSFNGATRALYSGNETAFALIDCINGHSCSMTPYATPKKCPEASGSHSGCPMMSFEIVTTLLVAAASVATYWFN